ncbi:MAG: hypothetical protein ACJ8F7_07175 [Gemmataceae bacterium]
MDRRAAAVTGMGESERDRWLDEQSLALESRNEQLQFGSRRQPLRHYLRVERLMRCWLGLLLAATVASLVSLPFAASRPDELLGLIVSVIIYPAIAAVLYFFRFFKNTLLRRLPPELRARGGNATLAEIDSELERPELCRQWGRLPMLFHSSSMQCLIITPSWVLYLSPRRCHILRLDEIVWVFQQFRGSSTFQWTDRVYREVCCRLITGRDVILRLWNPDWADDFVDELLRRRPEILIGHQTRCVELADAGPAALQAEVERRAAEFARLPERRQRDWLANRSREFRKTARRLEPGAT